LSKVIPLIGLGLGLIVIGAFWSLFDGSLSYFSDYVLRNDYYNLMKLGWDAMPVIVVIIGIFCLIAAGVAYKTQYVEAY
jgi:hypothetical protein